MIKNHKRCFIYICICVFMYFILHGQLNNQKYIKMIYWGLSYEEIHENRPLELEYIDKDGERQYAVISNWSPDDVWQHYYEVYYYLPSDVDKILGMKLSLIVQRQTEVSQYVSSIKSMELYQNKLQVQKLGPYQLVEMFSSDAEMELDGTYVRYMNADSDNITICASEQLIAQMNYNCVTNQAVTANIILYCMILFGFLIAVDYKRNDIYNAIAGCKRSIIGYRWYEWLLLFLLVNIGIAVAIVSLESEFCAHPDEYVYRMAVDYYLGKWVPPHGNEAWLAGTFSPYGFTRLTETTWYYFVAGKVGWFFYQFLGVERYYRILNLVICWGLLFLCWKQRKTDFWLTIAICISPQIWYLFSYATSDAWDYLWNVLAIYLVVSSKGLMNQLIYQRDKKVDFTKIIICGLVFSMVLLGKANFCFTLLCIFLDLIIKWIKAERNRKSRILFIYISVLFVSLGLVFLKSEMPNLIEYHEIEIPMNNAEKDIIYEITDATKEDSTTGLCLQQKGFSIYDVMFNMSHASFFRTLYSSTLGVYGMYAFWSGPVFFIGMIFLYMVLYCSGFFSKMKWNEWVQYLATPIFLIILTLVVLIYCWKVDYQPTGRYILSIFPIFAWTLSGKINIWKQKITYCAINLCMVLGLYSFWTVCIWNMVINIQW